MNTPNLFVVGAPKSGTTAMNHYLKKHPDVFMAVKELHFFGEDLKMKGRISKAEYMREFEAANEKKIKGEASVWYLYSSTAAAEIKSFAPDAKIIIMLRNPVEVIYSLHSQHLYDGNEDVSNFQKALKLDVLRRKGLNQPNAIDFYELPPYIDSVSFSEQVKRYFDVFGRANVKIIVYDDFVADTKKVVAETFSFLGVDPEINIQTNVINANKRVQHFGLHRMIKKPPSILQKIARVIIPFRSLRGLIMKLLYKRNIQSKPRKKMNENVRGRLKEELKGGVADLSTIVERDLSHWVA
ncbi:MAG: sulfotransferase [Flavitalea sp.]